MFIAMNRFRVKKGSEDAFEKVWLGRDSYLDRVPGFLEFHLLEGPEAEDHTFYSSHSVWQSKQAFEAWTRSEEFRAAHARAGNEATGPLYLEHPKFEKSLIVGMSHERPVTGKVAAGVGINRPIPHHRFLCGFGLPTPLIIAWLEVRVLPAPPRSPTQTEISRCRANRAELMGATDRGEHGEAAPCCSYRKVFRNVVARIDS
jgi:heme-degrading monooxygenase HmoA